MIFLKKLLLELLVREVSFRDLLKYTRQNRLSRSRDVTARSSGVKNKLDVESGENKETAFFNYKTSLPESRTKKRYHGYIMFLENPQDNPNKNQLDLDVKVHCDCPDYFYNFEYNNNKIGAGTMDPKMGATYHAKDSVAHNKKPVTQIPNLGPGLCKHLVSLTEYLKSNAMDVGVSPEKIAATSKVKRTRIKKPIPANIGAAPQPPNEPKIPVPAVQPVSVPIATQTPAQPAKTEPVSVNVGTAPEEPKEKDTAYSDSRSGDLMEESNGFNLYNKIKEFIKRNRRFQVDYEDT